MSGKKGRSGRHKTLSTLMKEVMVAEEQYLPDYYDALRNKALVTIKVECPHCNKGFEVPGGGDREALIYLIDRKQGKPKASTEIDVIGDLGITAKQVGILLEEARVEFLETAKQYQITEGKDVSTVLSEG